MKSIKKIIGPFRQLVTMDSLPIRGPVRDNKLELISEAGLLISEGRILKADSFELLRKDANKSVFIEEIQQDLVAIPGIVDPHTHICYAGSRARDYAKRLEGISYQEIATAGGGIWDTVSKTRAVPYQQLLDNTINRVQRMMQHGITTIEIKSGYGLNMEGEIKMLRVINEAGNTLQADLVPTCLAAHIIPRDFNGNSLQYLDWIINELLPAVLKNRLAKRVDIFVEKEAFDEKEATSFLRTALSMGFDLTVHADQFTTGGSRAAIAAGAISADHLEASGEKEIQALAKSQVTAIALPGASLGLGTAFAPARKILDAGGALAIGSDWNPGSAPMGDLLTQAAILGAYEKLSMAEALAAITVRAAHALNLTDRGMLTKGKMADMAAYPCSDFHEILYNQGQMKPSAIWKKGKKIINDVS